MASQEWLEKDFYAILGVPQDASKKDIERAYRKLARELHPDHNPDPTAEDRFKGVSEAYSVLHDDKARAEYDQIQLMKSGRGGFGGMGGGQGVHFDDLFGGGGAGGGFSDLFSDLFSRTGGGAHRRRSGSARGNDLRTHITLDFADAVKGTTTELRMRAPGECETCRGSGAKPGTAPSTCPRCNGRGLVTENQGAFSFAQPCPDCEGTGSVVTDPCPDCGGTGATTRDRVITVRVPAGIGDGQSIRLAGRGAPGEHGGPAGDLLVKVAVRSHPLFARDGDNVTLRLPVAFHEAAMGAKVKVPTLDGPVTLRIPEGTPTGRVLRVKGRGVPGKGDLLVTVDVEVPSSLSAEARDALEKYAAAAPAADRSKLEELTGQ
ncbi:molecular chaperone DnaJ [Glycomyces sp. TRM65418]|uniref:molecular chaperone DnaJ n=1 Tax=Glycomyces sp. TRM65418 TaxID=2867006 RepID=UPI001CE63CC5|nr:molecular chaperone DnaJ [Glycomyces sp. TRM65418]MCC3764620.1 molecular chaperone DnaJ [Glycomyces sp. TRM65418]QZD54284.1 molecular chaperone DnaJ [Glycomyces sp. TRM65418]